MAPWPSHFGGICVSDWALLVCATVPVCTTLEDAFELTYLAGSHGQVSRTKFIGWRRLQPGCSLVLEFSASFCHASTILWMLFYPCKSLLLLQCLWRCASYSHQLTHRVPGQLRQSRPILCFALRLRRASPCFLHRCSSNLAYSGQGHSSPASLQP